MISQTSSAIEWGRQDKVLVFLHYFGGAAMSWRWVAEQLPDYRCIAINLPGFGKAPAIASPSLRQYADAVCAELAALNVESYTLIGHSMGGKIALQVAAKSERPPEQVVLIAPSPPTQEPMPDEEKQRLLNNHPSQSNAETTLSSATQRALSQEQQALAIETHLIVEETAWRWWLLEGMNHSIADQMPQLQMPVSVLASKDDPVISYNTIESDVLGVISHAKLITTQGVGHLIPLEDPNWVAEQLRRLCCNTGMEQ
ncbi:MAG: alpha/beta hydrolase [Kastovskya adunca ATA6-11-RM4]|jgi:pimeloyl-ACP methyl ester carboxylesterase|nr:alpha/beta hydrolase [Kastovskya adunca ATA6-11-RM4]